LHLNVEISSAPNAATPIIGKVITQMESEDGWVPLGEVERQLANLASDFDPRTFGFRKLSDLVRRTNSFEIEHPKGGSMRIRLKSASRLRPKSKPPRGNSIVRRSEQAEMKVLSAFGPRRSRRWLIRDHLQLFWVAVF
jgi:hypothetical protein